MNILAKAGQTMRRFVAYDSPVAQTILTIWGVFVLAVCSWVFLIPLLTFELLVGWQPTHLAIWLGMASLLTLGPLCRGLIVASTSILNERGYPGHLARTFFSSIRRAPRALWLLWILVFPIGLFVAYDVALSGGSPSRMIPAIVLGVLLALVLVAVGALAETDDDRSLIELVTIAFAAMIRRVWLPLTWAFGLALMALASRIPAIGPTIVLFAPALWGLLVALVNGMWRFGR